MSATTLAERLKNASSAIPMRNADCLSRAGEYAQTARTRIVSKVNRPVASLRPATAIQFVVRRDPHTDGGRHDSRRRLLSMTLLGSPASGPPNKL